MLHNSLNQNEYDILHLDFTLQDNLIIGAAADVSLTLEVDSEFYAFLDATQLYQDLGFKSDANLFKNEKRAGFTNGETYPFKLYRAGVDITPTSGTVMIV